MGLCENFNSIQQRIRQYEADYHRPTGMVRLLAVSKGRSIEQIGVLADAGQSAFGENYLQEALPKIAIRPDLEWHFIGPIQSNKTQAIARHFAWVQSVAEQKIAKRLNDQRPASLPPLNICIQVNISHERNKSGISIADLPTLIDYCCHLPRLRLRGLMAIPAHEIQWEKQRDTFHQLFLLQQQSNKQCASHHLVLDTLSMGMSDDFAAAIAEGATLVRIGRALF